MNSKIYWLFATKEELLKLGVRESSIFENITNNGDHEDLTQAELTLEQAHALIPKDTQYCYFRKKGKFMCCPFWDKIRQFPDQSNGYCHYLKRGDDSTGGLLWDQCKECGIGDDLI